MLLHLAISEYLQEHHPSWSATIWGDSRIMIQSNAVSGTVIIVNLQTMSIYSYNIDSDAVVSCNYDNMLGRITSIICSS